MMKLLAFVGLSFLLTTLACGQSSWKKSGSSWRRGGSELADALGKSIRGEGNLKEEWKDVGDGFRDAGVDTADAARDSVEPKKKGSPESSKRSGE